MSQELRWMALLFGSIAWLSFVVLRRLLRPRPLAQRLAAEEPAEPDTTAKDPEEPLLMTQRGQDDIQQALRRAGYYRPTTLARFATLRAFLVLAPLVLAAGIGLLLPQERLQWILFGGLAGSVLGFSVPRFYLIARGRQRARRIEKGLPFAIDLLSLSLSAGQNTLNALRQVARELRFAHPILAEELEIVQEQAKLLSLGHALGQLAERVAVPEVRNLALLLIQSERLGADASAALLEFSSHQRANLRQRAEGQANRATFWMLFPSVCCLWVAASLILIGPLYLQFWKGFSAAAAKTNTVKQDVEKANLSGRPAKGSPAARTGP